MMIEFSKHLLIESEVELTTQDIRDMLQQDLYDAIETCKDDPKGKQFRTMKFVRSLVSCLTAVSDQMIDTLEDSQRVTIANALRKQADRFGILLITES